MPCSHEELVERAKILQGSINELIPRFNRLAMFAEANIWQADARAVIALLEREQAALLESRECEEQSLEMARLKREGRKIIGGFFASRADETRCEDYIREIDKSRRSAGLAIETLMDFIDRIPGTKAEQQEMLDELHGLLDDLKEEYRKARSGPRAAKVSLAGLQGKNPRIARLLSRANRAAQQNPTQHESLKLERMIIEMEERCERIAGFSGDAPTVDEMSLPIQRCDFCGRPMTNSLRCIGCGATFYSANS